VKQTHACIALRTILPALIFIAALDMLYLGSGWWMQAFIQVNALLWAILMVFFPILALARGRCSFNELGFRKSLSRWMYLWSTLAGACWRLLDMLLVGTSISFGKAWGGEITWIAMLNGLLVAPLVEETFFRGFLQTGLQEHLGEGWAIVVQALLFALHPIHLSQNGFHFVLFVLFGLAAGAIYRRTRSLYPLLCAHGIANILPEALYMVSEWWWATDWVFTL
jgi:membrane protease YdiL (CAAX protease family)